MKTAPGIVLVCQAGRIEAQALLLAASLRALQPDLELTAAIPGDLPAQTSEALGELGVAMAPIDNPLAADYPIGHKLAALAAGRVEGTRVFLDSDMLCVEPPDWPQLATHAFAAKPADIATFGDADAWGRLYRRFGLPQPTLRVATTVSGALTMPYFNAGMLATAEPRYLAAAWIDACCAIDGMADIAPKRPWLDQIGLPLAVARLGLSARALGEAWNYPAHIQPLRGTPSFVHYHVPEVVAREAALRCRVAALLRRWPAVEKVVRADAAWTGTLAAIARAAHDKGRIPDRAVRVRNDDLGEGSGRLVEGGERTRIGTKRVGIVTAAPRRDGGACERRQPARDPRRAAATHEMLITGIPRSGTSYLCSLLGAFDNIAAINEPEELFEGLARSADPWAVPLLHASLRARIDAGQAVPNKLDAAGSLIHDTAKDDARVPYRPHLRDADWVLATKNTLAYLARLDGIPRVMPQARIVAMVRHPLDTLASWKASFLHLANGDPTRVPIGGTSDRWLSPRMRAGLSAIASLPSAAVRRAAWWRLLASELVAHRDRVEIIRYEDLVADPAAVLQQILGSLAAVAGSTAATPKPSLPSTAGRTRLDAEDWRAAGMLCAGVAEAFGYRTPAAPQSGAGDAADTPLR